MSSVPDGYAMQIRERDNHTCQRCHKIWKAGRAFHVHHAVPTGAGGSDEPDNLTTLCNSCHKQVHSAMRAAGLFEVDLTTPGGRIRHARELLNYLQYHLAAQLGIPQPLLSAYENNEKPMPNALHEQAVRFLSALNRARTEVLSDYLDHDVPADICRVKLAEVLGEEEA